VLCPVGARLHTLLWVPLHNGIQGNEDVDALARKRLGSSFRGPRLAIYVPSCVGRLKIKESLTKEHSEC
jgi:hypothetical protein